MKIHSSFIIIIIILQHVVCMYVWLFKFNWDNNLIINFVEFFSSLHFYFNKLKNHKGQHTAIDDWL